MGTPKWSLRLGGRTFLERVVDAARGCSEVVIVTRGEVRSIEGVRLLNEPEHPQRAAVLGLRAALADARTRGDSRAWLLASDLPLLSRVAVDWLVQRFEATASSALVPVHEGKPQVLCAGYSVDLLPLLNERIAHDELALHPILSLVDRAERVEETEWRRFFDAAVFTNVNDRTDYQTLEERFA